MLQKLLQEFIQFSKENWWVYILLCIALGVVVHTGKGNMIEVIGIFFLNITAATCNMLMMSSYKDKKFMEGSIFILSANILYTLISLYALLIDGDMQYIMWQISFLLTGLYAFFWYNYNYKLFFVHPISIFMLNSVIFYILITYFEVSLPVLIQSWWLFAITFGLSLLDNTRRFFAILVWNIFVVCGTSLILFENYSEWSILWVTIAYGLLSLSICSYNIRILPKYISRLHS